MMNRPIIQGGMGVYVSTPFLAGKCSMSGSVLGTVSGVAAGLVMLRILQTGDTGGHFRRSLEHFPFPDVAERVLAKYFVSGGIQNGQRFKTVPAFGIFPQKDQIELTVAANFAFVWLAKEGHSHPISVNYLEKMQVFHLCSIFGAMLAGVDCVTMGAGLTHQIPEILKAFVEGRQASYKLTIEGRDNVPYIMAFAPRTFFGKVPEMKLPKFIPIVSSHILAARMSKTLRGGVDGFVVELPIAGGHNAPPREKGVFNQKGEPLYSKEDEVSFKKLVDLGIPFWIGGGFATPQGLARARALGASGIQAGTIYALCEDSGMDKVQRDKLRQLGFCGELQIRTSATASPTGYPFKVAQVTNTLSDPHIFMARSRVCDLGALAVPYMKEDGSIGFRCPAAPIAGYLARGGAGDRAEKAVCLCNGLLSAAGLGNANEPPIFTLGDDLGFLRMLMHNKDDFYSARDATDYILGQ